MNSKFNKLKSLSVIKKATLEVTLMDLSNVRIREHFGLVSNDTHTGQFCFLVSPPKNKGSVEKFDYVLIDHPLFGEACQILAVITDITSYEEVAGSTVGDKMGKMLATAKIEGYIDLRNEIKSMGKVLVPPNPGCRVYIPLKKFLEDILNRNSKGEVLKAPLLIGTFEGSSVHEQDSSGNIKCFVDAQELTSKHAIITSVAGAGKTHIAKLLIQEISGKTSHKIIVFDPYNEYSEASETQAKAIVVNSKMDRDSLIKELKRGQLTLLNGYGLSPKEKRSVYIEALQLLLKLRWEEKIEPLFVIIEESENLIGETLDQVISEGRKIGVFVCLLTTHPAQLGGNILSQIGTQIIGKTTSKDDIEILENFAGTASTLPDLNLGEWVFNGIITNRPLKVHLK
jgi:DNA helicase HerA-like ATPase